MTHSVPHTVACPVCEMPVDTLNCEFVAERGGRPHFFCADSCRQKFLASDCCKPGKPKGRWGRYLDRMAKFNEKSFGPSGPKCH
jgi:YHS domain-containing protein